MCGHGKKGPFPTSNRFCKYAVVDGDVDGKIIQLCCRYMHRLSHIALFDF